MTQANTYRESLEIVLAHCRPPAVESVPFREAAGRVSAEELRAERDDPPAPKSAMDGFALRAEETATATPKRPVRFAYDEVVGAGHRARGRVIAGRAIRVMTGALLPEGTDAVVKQEDTLRGEDGPREGAAAGAGTFAVTAPLTPGENVFAAGSRFGRGDRLVPRGVPLMPQALGLLAGMGRERAAVYRRPRVGLLALGDELVEPGSPLAPGRIHVSNLYALEAESDRYGGVGIGLGIARDDPGEIARRLRPWLPAGNPNETGDLPQEEACDILLTLGGSHRGDFDFVDDVLETLGARLHFRRTLINFGGSTLFATRGETLFFGLPGTPLASWMAFELLVRPALWRMAGRAALEHPRLAARLAVPLERRPGRSHFIPARLRFAAAGLPEATPLGERPTGDLPTSLLADGLIRYPEGAAVLKAGETVSVAWLRSCT